MRLVQGHEVFWLVFNGFDWKELITICVIRYEDGAGTGDPRPRILNLPDFIAEARPACVRVLPSGTLRTLGTFAPPLPNPLLSRSGLHPHSQLHQKQAQPLDLRCRAKLLQLVQSACRSWAL